MLYAKVDENGNPIERAINYKQLEKIFHDQGTLIPPQSHIRNILDSISYVEVPQTAEIPTPKAGFKSIPGIPVKQETQEVVTTVDENGAEIQETQTVISYLRTWEYEETDSDIPHERRMRERRNNLLKKYIDTISPVRWNAFTDEEKQEVTDFYQALLDLSNQETWPHVFLPRVPRVLFLGQK